MLAMICHIWDGAGMYLKVAVLATFPPRGDDTVRPGLGRRSHCREVVGDTRHATAIQGVALRARDGVMVELWAESVKRMLRRSGVSVIAAHLGWMLAHSLSSRRAGRLSLGMSSPPHGDVAECVSRASRFRLQRSSPHPVAHLSAE